MMKLKKVHHGNMWMPVLYCEYYGILKGIAREYGYALAVHGSLTRDLDLIAVPWVQNYRPAEELLEAFRKALGSERHDGRPWDSMEVKPHGRIGYTINSGGGGYLDISIMEPIRLV